MRFFSKLSFVCPGKNTPTQRPGTGWSQLRQPIRYPKRSINSDLSLVCNSSYSEHINGINAVFFRQCVQRLNWTVWPFDPEHLDRRYWTVKTLNLNTLNTEFNCSRKRSFINYLTPIICSLFVVICTKPGEPEGLAPLRWPIPSWGGFKGGVQAPPLLLIEWILLKSKLSHLLGGAFFSLNLLSGLAFWLFSFGVCTVHFLAVKVFNFCGQTVQTYALYTDPYELNDLCRILTEGANEIWSK
jgi:hypothetical protein